MTKKFHPKIRLLSDPKGMLSFRPKPFSEAFPNALVVFDTNALLVPYCLNSKSISEIEVALKKLIAKKALFLPGQVIRELFYNKVEKVKNLFSNFVRKSQFSFDRLTFPILDNVSGYAEFQNAEKELGKALDAYRSAAKKVIAGILSWETNDPIISMYQSIFLPEVVIEPSFEQTKILDEFSERISSSIPPGYKDKGKDDEGIGDYLIWLSILEIGKTHKKDLIFVSGEEKADWVYKSENRIIHPRIELIEEYRLASENHGFYMTQFSSLLEMLATPSEVVREIKTKEKEIVDNNNGTRAIHPMVRHHLAEKAIQEWMNDKWEGAEIVRKERYFPDYTIRQDGKIIGLEVKVPTKARSLPSIVEDVYSTFVNFGKYPEIWVANVFFNRGEFDKVHTFYEYLKMQTDKINILIAFSNDNGELLELIEV